MFMLLIDKWTSVMLLFACKFLRMMDGMGAVSPFFVNGHALMSLGTKVPSNVGAYKVACPCYPP